MFCFNHLNNFYYLILIVSIINHARFNENDQKYTLIRPKVLTNVLSQANTGGVENTLLLNNDGALLAFSGFHNKDARITSAIASNVWSAYEKHGHNSFREDPLQYLIINCEGGNVIVTQVANLLLCLYANTDNLGILKTKITKLKEQLEVPLQSIQT